MHLGQVLDRLASAGFTLRATKCAVGVWIRDPVGGLGRPQTGRGGVRLVGAQTPRQGAGSVGLAGGSHRSGRAAAVRADELEKLSLMQGAARVGTRARQYVNMKYPRPPSSSICPRL